MSAELKEMLQDQARAFQEFKASQDRRFNEIEKKLNRGALSGIGLRDAAGAREERNEAETKAFDRYLRAGVVGELEGKEASVDSDPKGGYMAPTYLDSEIAVTERDACPLRQVARVIPVDSDGYEKLVSTGGFVAQTVGERETRSETETGNIAKVAPSFYEIYAEPPITQRLLDDADHDVVGWLTEELGLAFGAKEGAMFANGSGVKEAKGLLTYPIVANPTFGQLKQVKSGTSGAVVADKLWDVVFALKPGYRRRAVWMANALTIQAVRQLKDSQGRWIFEAPKQAGEPGMLLGYPVYEWPDLPAPAANSHSLLFGDFKRGYTIADVRGGTRVLRDPYTKKGWVLFYTTKRGGGGLEDSNAIVVHTLAA